MASVFKRNNGIFYVVLKNVNGKRTWHSTNTHDHNEAEKIAEAIIQKYEKPRVMTLSGLAKMIDQYAQSNFAKGTVEIYKYSFQNLIESMGDIVIKGVTPLLIEKFKQDCLKKVSPVRVNMYSTNSSVGVSFGE